MGKDIARTQTCILWCVRRKAFTLKAWFSCIHPSQRSSSTFLGPAEVCVYLWAILTASELHRSGLMETTLHARATAMLHTYLPMMRLGCWDCLFWFLAHTCSVWARFLKHTSNRRMSSEGRLPAEFQEQFSFTVEFKKLYSLCGGL